MHVMGPVFESVQVSPTTHIVLKQLSFLLVKLVPRTSGIQGLCLAVEQQPHMSVQIPAKNGLQLKKLSHYWFGPAGWHGQAPSMCFFANNFDFFATKVALSPDPQAPPLFFTTKEYFEP